MIQTGNLVGMINHEGEWIGLVLSVQPMEGCYKDSAGKIPVYICKVLWNKDVPMWMGGGKIAQATDGILAVIK